MDKKVSFHVRCVSWFYKAVAIVGGSILGYLSFGLLGALLGLTGALFLSVCLHKSLSSANELF